MLWACGVVVVATRTQHDSELDPKYEIVKAYTSVFVCILDIKWIGAVAEDVAPQSGHVDASSFGAGSDATERV
jgi:hypothetical protein